MRYLDSFDPYRLHQISKEVDAIIQKKKLTDPSWSNARVQIQDHGVNGVKFVVYHPDKEGEFVTINI